jgi:hypothetical protein
MTISVIIFAVLASDKSPLIGMIVCLSLSMNFLFKNPLIGGENNVLI